MALGLSLSLSLTAQRRRAFVPTNLFPGAETGAWFDPSDLSSLFSDTAGTVPAVVDGPVGLMRDRSGRGGHAIADGGDSTRPTLRLSGSLYYLEADGVNDYMRASFTCGQPWDRVSAIRQIAWTASGRVFGGRTTIGGNLFQTGASPALVLNSGSNGPSTASLAIGVDGVVTERHDGASSRVAINAGNYVTGDAGTTAPGGVNLFADVVGGNPGNVRLYGMVQIARALTDAETDSLRAFMAASAGVTL